MLRTIWLASILVVPLLAMADDRPGLMLDGTPLYSPTLKSRSITAENPTGAPGSGCKEGNERKWRPCLWELKKGQVYTFAEIAGPGAIRHIWLTVPPREARKMRNIILRFYWDDQQTPSVEAPLTDFFGVSHGKTVPFASELLTTPEGKGFNSYFLMPFARKARLTVCNEMGEDAGSFFYQVDYTVGDEVTAATPYFHAQFRRVPNTTLGQDYVILDGVKGRGRYLGVNFGLIDRFADKAVWWGEGELKIYIDDDEKHPTICGTGSEDYVGSGWGLAAFWHANAGAPLAKGKYISFYRFHIKDPVYFSNQIKVTMQQLGNDGSWEPADPKGKLADMIDKGFYRKTRRGGFFERVDDVCSTAYWYQTLPTQPFPKFPDHDLRALNLE